MAVAIRLKRLGTKKDPHNRIVVIDSHRSRDGRFIEEIGYYNPAKKPALFNIDKERALYWLKVGAKPSGVVKKIFKDAGIFQVED